MCSLYKMSRFLLIIEVLSALVFFKTNASRILCVFPTPAYSHQIVYRSLTQALAERGHDVVVITTHPFPPGEAPANLTEINLYDVSHHIWQDGVSKVYGKDDDFFTTNLFLKVFRDIFENQLQSKPVQDLIKKEGACSSFDLIIQECFVFPALGLLNIFDAPAIQTSTFGPMPSINDMFGAPTHPLLYPTLVYHRLYNLTFWEKLNNLYKTAINKYLIYSNEVEDDKMLQRTLGHDIQPLKNLYERVQAYFQSVYSIWIDNPPVPQGMVYLGGIHQKPPKSLPQELQLFMDSFEQGVIYVSFGTNVHPSLLSQEKIDMMERVFSELPYGVLWKRDQVTKTKTANNLKISTWFPQADLLHHSKMRLFITQAGLQSTEEAIMAGVPLITIPIYGDQWMHAEHCVHQGICLQLDWSVITEEQLRVSIARVTEDNNYKVNVVRLRNVMNDQPQSSQERAIWWTEYVIRHGSTLHLRPASANMSWIQYYEVELIIIVVFGVLFLLGIFCFILFTLARCFYQRRMYKRHFKII